VWVLLGNGEGTFQPAAQYPAGISPDCVTVGDFNRDGKLDMAASSFYSNDVSVLLGNGNGTFRPAVSYPAGIHPMSVVAGDFNGDGTWNLVIPNYGSGDVSILLGKGDGTFQSGPSVPAVAGPVAVVVADFNSDRKPDIAASNYVSGTLSVMLNPSQTVAGQRPARARGPAQSVATARRTFERPIYVGSSSTKVISMFTWYPEMLLFSISTRCSLTHAPVTLRKVLVAREMPC